MLAVMNREDSCPPTLDQEAGGWAPPHSGGHFELGAKPFNSYKGKKVYFHVRATKNINACLINYFLKCLFHFGSGSLKNVWSTIIIISGKKYTLLYFCFCCRSSCSSGWKVNTSLCSAAAHIFVVSGCPLGGRAGAGYAVGTQRTQRRHRNVGSIQRPAWVQVCWGSLGWRRKIKLEGEEAFRKSPGKESGCALRLWSPWEGATGALSQPEGPVAYASVSGGLSLFLGGSHYHSVPPWQCGIFVSGPLSRSRTS